MSTITTGAAAVPSLSHDWRDQHASWNQGAMDGWLLTHVASDGEANGSFTMGYYDQEDIPFHWALAKAFTLADNYHCSVMGPTDVNRIFWEEGGNDPQGKAGGPVLETGGVRDLTYESGPETLYNAGISYKFYQGIGWPQDTITSYFTKFQSPGQVPTALYNAVTSTGTLFGNGTPGGIGDPENPTPASNSEMGFEEDCANGVLPDVSFIGSKSGYDEHPAALPAAGAQFLATKLEALAANEELWNTTVFIINYDENDGFFDHVVPPTPEPRRVPGGVHHPGLAGRHPRRRPAPRRRLPGPGLRHLALDGGRPDLLRSLRPHLRPAAHRGGGGGRRPVRQGPGHLPQHQPLAAQDLQRLDRGPAAGHAAGSAVEHAVHARHHGGQPGRPAGGRPPAAAAAPRRDPAVPLTARTRRLARRPQDAERDASKGWGRDRSLPQPLF